MNVCGMMRVSQCATWIHPIRYVHSSCNIFSHSTRWFGHHIGSFVRQHKPSRAKDRFPELERTLQANSEKVASTVDGKEGALLTKSPRKPVLHEKGATGESQMHHLWNDCELMNWEMNKNTLATDKFKWKKSIQTFCSNIRTVAQICVFLCTLLCD